MAITVKELIARLRTFDPTLEVMVGTAYDNDLELTDDFAVTEVSVNSIEKDFYMEVEEDGTQQKNVVALW